MCLEHLACQMFLCSQPRWGDLLRSLLSADWLLYFWGGSGNGLRGGEHPRGQVGSGHLWRRLRALWTPWLGRGLKVNSSMVSSIGHVLRRWRWTLSCSGPSHPIVLATWCPKRRENQCPKRIWPERRWSPSLITLAPSRGCVRSTRLVHISKCLCFIHVFGTVHF